MSRKRYSIPEERITALGRLVGVNYTDKTYENFKCFLERYAYLKSDVSLVSENCVNEFWEEAPALFGDMISYMSVPVDRIDAYLVKLINSHQYMEIIEKTRDKVREFSGEGELYYMILTKLYFLEEPLTDGQVEKLSKYSHGTYYLKKKYAIMLYGICFWSQIYDHWMNSKEEMKYIEAKHGRDGSLAENARDNKIAIQ